MRIYSYVVATDSGFAPMPFGRYCTLACCKPAIRRTAQVGDWIVGLTPRSRGIVYAMRVTEKIDFATYWQDRRFRNRRPDMNAKRIRARCGDNIYEPLPRSGFRQLPSGHSNPDGSEDRPQMAHDLGGRHVLVSGKFTYFGSSAPDLPPRLSFLKIGRAHRCRFTEEQVQAVADYVGALPRGVLGRPSHWPEKETSWKAC